MIDKKRRPTFAGAADLVGHAKAAAKSRRPVRSLDEW
jgi:hypothetical protein